MSTLSVDTIQGKTTAGTIAMPSGMIVQVQTRTTTTNVTTSNVYGSASSNWVASDLYVEITPKFSNSLIKIEMNCPYWFHADGSVSADYFMTTIYRDSTNIGDGTWGSVALFRGGDLAGDQYNKDHNVFITTFDSPSSTSTLTYKMYFKTYSGNEVRVIDGIQENRATAMEIKQ